jgi:hypothetical protein
VLEESDCLCYEFVGSDSGLAYSLGDVDTVDFLVEVVVVGCSHLA